MNIRNIALTALLLFSVSPVVRASGKGGEAAKLSFHLETDQNNNPKMVFPQMDGGKQRFYYRTPEITLKDVESFRPFPCTDNQNYGLLLKLKDAGKRRLAAISTANPGKYLLAMSNGVPLDGVLIDKPVDDGYIVVWKGITETDIKLLDKEMPRTGEKKKRG